MTEEDRREAGRQLALELIHACWAGDQPRVEAVVTSDFRCWSPLDDWQEGRSGVEAIRRVMSPAGNSPGSVAAVISAGDVVVAECAPTEGGGVQPGPVTAVLRLQGSLITEAACYADPRSYPEPPPRT